MLTSYIVMGAICTPLTGWLSNRIGRRKLFLICVIGFMITSALCGAAQNLFQLVLFRLLQGAMGAPLVPMSQALLLDLIGDWVCKKCGNYNTTTNKCGGQGS